MSKLSVIIPTLNESSNAYFPRILESLSTMREIEIIISDGGSTDNTLKLAEYSQVKILSNQTSSRAERLNYGLKEATGEIILLHHPRSLISLEGIEHLLSMTSHLHWGGFTHSFDFRHPLLKFTSWYSNNIRGGISGIIYLDHCIFLKREVLQKFGELPKVDIFEDTILSQILLEKYGKPTILPHLVETSAIRFRTNGIWKQALLNQYLKIKFHLNGNHKKMNELYEKDISLNSKYERK